MENEITDLHRLMKEGYLLWCEQIIVDEKNYYLCRSIYYKTAIHKHFYVFIGKATTTIHCPDHIIKKAIDIIDSGEFARQELAWKMK